MCMRHLLVETISEGSAALHQQSTPSVAPNHVCTHHPTDHAARTVRREVNPIDRTRVRLECVQQMSFAQIPNLTIQQIGKTR